MKKITFFLCALLISAMSFAQTTVTKTTSQLVTEHGWTVSSGNTIGTLATEFALDEVVTISTTGKPNCGSIWGTAPNNDYRLYQASSGNIVVTVKSGYELKSITFTYSISNSGTLKDGSTNIPSKKALDVTGTTKTLTVGNTSTKTNGQVRITEFSVTYVATAPADAKKYTVTATVNDEKMGKVTGTGEYVENSTATIKAVANPGYEFVKWEDSSTANPRTITVTANTEVAATFQAMTPITCAEVNNLADGDALLLGEFTVVYVNDRYTYIQDATGSALLYASGLGLEAGNVVTGLAGTLSIYNGLPEIIPANKKADWTITNGTVPEPTVFAAAPAKTDVNKYVKFEGVTLSANATFTTESATNATMVVNGTNVTLRNTFKLAATLSKDKTYDIVGFVAIYNSNIQVYFLSAEELVVNHTITVSANPAEAGTVTGGGEFEETDEITVKAVANDGYEFVNWTENEVEVSTDAEYTFEVLADRALVANFKEVEPEVIAYELNGGELVVEVPTQEELWASFKTAAGLTTLGTLAEITEAGAGKPHNEQDNPCACRIICAKLLDANVNAIFALPEWAWLKAYIMTVQSGLPEASSAAWRYAIAAFFLQSQHSAYPTSADFTEAGKPENWGPAYQAAHAVVLPTEPVDAPYTLPTPVKEGYKFVGWYDNAEGTGEAYTVIPADWSGTLYAIWEAEGPATALENIAVEGKVVKTIINGQLIIVKNGVQYNAQGQVIK